MSVANKHTFSHSDAKALVLQVINDQWLDLRHDDLGDDPEKMDALIDLVCGHPQALMLLAREVAAKGVATTTENVQAVMLDLQQRYPKERELPLLASVELSLRHLSEEIRAEITGLAVFHDGADMSAMAYVLEVDENRVRTIGMDLIQVGLAKSVGDYGYVRFDPALPVYLTLGLGENELAAYRHRWIVVMGELVEYLYQQRFHDLKLVSKLMQLELPNLMVYLQRLRRRLATGQVTVEQVIGKLGHVEQLLENLDQEQALALVVAWREQVTQGAGE